MTPTNFTPSSLGIEVEEERGPDHSIARLGTARTAFVGRTLRGPINRPILLTSFTEFQHMFGGLWQPSLPQRAISDRTIRAPSSERDTFPGVWLPRLWPSG